MHILFTEDDAFVHHRSRAFRGGLLRNFHRVTVLRDPSRIPAADLWLHGLSHKPEILPDKRLLGAMSAFPGPVGFFQNDDHPGFALEKIPPHLRDRAALFLRNVWPSDPGRIDAEIRDRVGFVNPLLKPLPALPGKPLASRVRQAVFYGAATGSGRYSRADALRILINAGLPFLGGLVKSNHTQDPPPDLLVEPLDPSCHARILSDSAICLALHGNCPLTYRLFEGFSRRCLVVAQSLASIHFVDCGLTPGVHYAEVREDFTDLADCIARHLVHPHEAQKIADAGFAHFTLNFRYSGVNLPQPLYREIAASWKGVSLPRGKVTINRLVTKLLLPVIRSL